MDIKQAYLKASEPNSVLPGAAFNSRMSEFILARREKDSRPDMVGKVYGDLVYQDCQIIFDHLMDKAEYYSDYSGSAKFGIYYFLYEGKKGTQHVQFHLEIDEDDKDDTLLNKLNWVYRFGLAYEHQAQATCAEFEPRFAKFLTHCKEMEDVFNQIGFGYAFDAKDEYEDENWWFCGLEFDVNRVRAW